MSKITLPDVANLTNEVSALATINGNSATIKTAMDNTLSRDGTSPNTMLSSLDMNSNQILNLPAPTTAGSPLRLQDAFSGTIPLVPTGGTTNQVLAKSSNADFAMSWINGAASVTSINGQTGALVYNYKPMGRVTLASSVPVMTASVTGATSVIYTPYQGNIAPIYDGTNMVPTVFTEISQATTDATKSPAAVAASKIYDLFVWNDSGTIRCTRGPAWTNSTTRGYTLTMISGILLNTSTITNGPAALRGTFVGTIASNGSSTIDFIFGSSSSGGGASVLNVWNTYNRVQVGSTVTDNGTSYTYTTGTIRQARASAGMQVSIVTGLSEEPIAVVYTSELSNTANATAQATIGVGYNTTSAITSTRSINYGNSTISDPCVNYMTTPIAGTNVIAAVEKGDGTFANTFNLNNIAQLTLLYWM